MIPLEILHLLDLHPGYCLVKKNLCHCKLDIGCNRTRPQVVYIHCNYEKKRKIRKKQEKIELNKINNTRQVIAQLAT